MSQNNNNNNKLCFRFMEGYCQEGKDCKFTHNSSACKFYYFDGTCSDGKKCSYQHNEVSRKAKANQNSNTNNNNQKGGNTQNNNKQVKYEQKTDNNNKSNNEQKSNNNSNNNNNNKQPQQQQQGKVLYRVKDESKKDEEKKEDYDDRNNYNNNRRNQNNNYNKNSNNNKNNNGNYRRKKSEEQYLNYRETSKNGNNNNQKGEYGNNSRNINGNRNNIKVNTESFDPEYTPADVKIRSQVYFPKQTYNKPIESREVITIPNRFQQDVDDLSIYNGLLKEIQQSGKEEKMWKLWHGDNHLIADDKITWKKDCPTFNMIIDAIRDYFKMDIKATRLNWYRDSSEWKPYHHDAAAVKPDKAKTQNLTVGVSFGAERELAFEHAKNRCVVTFPQPNGCMIAFSKDVNIMWRHGVPQVPPEQKFNKGRISIIAWGWVDNMVDVQ